MAMYIDAEHLMEKLSRMIDYCQKDNKVNGLTALFQVGDAIMDCPTADVEEVRHGEWILHPDGSGTCKICNTHQKAIWDMDNWQNFCGHCGAKMDGTLKERGGEK